MASQPNTGGPSGLPLSLIAQAIPRLSRHDLEALTERLIDHLDAFDGDPDFEEIDAEDSFVLSGHATGCGSTGPGCEICDPDEAVDDKGCDDINGDFSDPVTRAEQRERIRRTRCYLRRSAYRGLPSGYRLYDEPAVPTKRQLLKRKRGVPRRPRA